MGERCAAPARYWLSPRRAEHGPCRRQRARRTRHFAAREGAPALRSRRLATRRSCLKSAESGSSLIARRNMAAACAAWPPSSSAMPRLWIALTTSGQTPHVLPPPPGAQRPQLPDRRRYHRVCRPPVLRMRRSPRACASAAPRSATGRWLPARSPLPVVPIDWIQRAAAYIRAPAAERAGSTCWIGACQHLLDKATAWFVPYHVRADARGLRARPLSAP